MEGKVMHVKRILALLLTGVILLSLAACGGGGGGTPAPAGTGSAPAPAGTNATAPSEKTHLVFADVGWDSILFHNAVAGLIAEEVFGYTWEEMSGSTPLTHEALLGGEIDVHMEVWTDNLPTYKADLAAGKLKELSLNFGDNIQGLYVPRYVIEGDAARGIAAVAPDLKTVKDLANYPELFPDHEDPGMGVIYGGPPGWEVTVILENKWKVYGLDAMYNYESPGNDAILAAAMVGAFDRGEPIVAYYWSPTWLLGLYDFVLLEDEPYDEATFQDGLCAFPSVQVMICASNDFYASNPDYCAFLSKYQTSSPLTNEALAHIQDTGDSYPQTARWFLGQHPELVDEWLTADQAEMLRAAL